MKITRNIHDVVSDLLELLVSNGSLDEEEARGIVTRQKADKVGKYSPAFEELWLAYPARLTDSGVYVKVGKAGAYSEWLRCPVTGLLPAVQAYAKQHPDGKYVKDMARWLKGKPWEDQVVEAPKADEPKFKSWEDE